VCDHELAFSYAEQAGKIAQAMGSRARQAQVLVAGGRVLAGMQRVPRLRQRMGRRSGSTPRSAVCCR
jgi:hypothetical protein